MSFDASSGAVRNWTVQDAVMRAHPRPWHGATSDMAAGATLCLKQRTNTHSCVRYKGRRRDVHHRVALDIESSSLYTGQSDLIHNVTATEDLVELNTTRLEAIGKTVGHCAAHRKLG